MSSDKAQLAALNTHLQQQRTVGCVYRADGLRLAVAEVEAVAIGSKVYRAAELIEMAQEYELVRKPLTDVEVVEAQRAAAQIVARVEVVRAALEWRKHSKDYSAANTSDRAVRTLLGLDLCKAVDAFLAAGGSEVGG